MGRKTEKLTHELALFFCLDLRIVMLKDSYQYQNKKLQREHEFEKLDFDNQETSKIHSSNWSLLIDVLHRVYWAQSLNLHYLRLPIESIL